MTGLKKSDERIFLLIMLQASMTLLVSAGIKFSQPPLLTNALGVWSRIIQEENTKAQVTTRLWFFFSFLIKVFLHLWFDSLLSDSFPTVPKGFLIWNLSLRSLVDICIFVPRLPTSICAPCLSTTSSICQLLAVYSANKIQSPFYPLTLNNCSPAILLVAFACCYLHLNYAF